MGKSLRPRRRNGLPVASSTPPFQASAIAYCLTAAGITEAHLDYAVFYEKPLDNFGRILETQSAFGPESWASFQASTPLWARSKMHMNEVILAGLGRNFRGELCFTDHHESHASSAFYPSPFEEAAILTLDAVGGWDTSTIGCGIGNRDQHSTLRYSGSLIPWACCIPRSPITRDLR